MYLPYIRGRQYELLALRELAVNNLLGDYVIPVIEPVKLSPTLIKTISEYIRVKHQVAVIRNPVVGSFMKDLQEAKADSKEETYKKIEIIDFANLNKISPFIANNSMGIPYLQHAINIEHLKLISQEIAKPLRRHDSALDYLPTQYISDYIKSQGYDGVEYISTMCKDGYNLAVFDENAFKCTKTTVHDIKSLSYTYEPIN